tara:strand:- start:8484 stop:8939 length:456 start_codon:yes stop_codon:yes gene_type:complete
MSDMEANEADTQTDWPKNTEMATADQMIRHSIRAGAIDHDVALLWMRDSDRFEHGTVENVRSISNFAFGVGSFIANTQVALLLHEIQKRDGELADTLARLVFDLTEDGGVLGELSWEWLDARGVDADGLFAWSKTVAQGVFEIQVPNEVEL